MDRNIYIFVVGNSTNHTNNNMDTIESLSPLCLPSGDVSEHGTFDNEVCYKYNSVIFCKLFY